MNKSVVYHSDEASACISGETQRSNSVAYNSGTFIWTLHGRCLLTRQFSANV